ncbi:MAG: RNA polymerase sigma factor [Limisphaerales bacterium]
MLAPHAEAPEVPDSPDNPAAREWFDRTRWSRVIRAAGGTETQSRQALEELCRDYWYPLYTYARWRKESHEDACDHVQEFFLRLIEHRTLSVADPARGKFRTFLLSCFQHFLTSEVRRDKAVKRGGRITIVSIDEVDAEQRFRNEPVDHATPEKHYDRAWAVTLLNRAYTAVRRRSEETGKVQLFDAIWPFLTGGAGRDDCYLEVGRRLGMTEGAVKTAAHRLRDRLRDALREEIAQTVRGAGELDEEMRAFFAALV